MQTVIYIQIGDEEKKLLREIAWNLRKMAPPDCPQCHGYGTITIEDSIQGTKATCPKCLGTGANKEYWHP